MVVRGGVGAEGELVLGLRRLAEVIEDQAGLHAGEAALGIDLDDLVQVLGEVDDHGDVAALAGEARAAAVREHRGAVIAADAHRLDDVVGCARDDDADRQLSIVGAAGRIERAVAGPEPHLSLDCAAEVVLEAADVDLLERRRRRGEAAVGIGRNAHQAA